MLFIAIIIKHLKYKLSDITMGCYRTGTSKFTGQKCELT